MVPGFYFSQISNLKSPIRGFIFRKPGFIFRKISHILVCFYTVNSQKCPKYPKNFARSARGFICRKSQISNPPFGVLFFAKFHRASHMVLFFAKFFARASRGVLFYTSFLPCKSTKSPIFSSALRAGLYSLQNFPALRAGFYFSQISNLKFPVRGFIRRKSQNKNPLPGF